jgi:hypothetical protein
MCYERRGKLVRGRLLEGNIPRSHPNAEPYLVNPYPIMLPLVTPSLGLGPVRSRRTNLYGASYSMYCPRGSSKCAPTGCSARASDACLRTCGRSWSSARVWQHPSIVLDRHLHGRHHSTRQCARRVGNRCTSCDCCRAGAARHQGRERRHVQAYSNDDRVWAGVLVTPGAALCRGVAQWRVGTEQCAASRGRTPQLRLVVIVKPCMVRQ